jgi:hypothetical protein
MKTAQHTGVSVESAERTFDDAYLRTLNKTGPSQASQDLASIEADAKCEGTKKNGDVCKDKKPKKN